MYFQIISDSELLIFHIAECCMIPEELITDKELEVIYFRKTSRYINSRCHIKFVLFTVYQYIFKSL